MPLPGMLDIKVEFAFGADPDGDPGSWTFVDATARLLEQTISIQQGRTDEASTADASSVSFVLDNNSGDYTPELATSPHYPHIVAGVPCRIWVEGSVRLFGFVASWLPEWPAGDVSDDESGDLGHAIVAVTVNGVMRRLGQGRDPLGSALARHVPNRPDVIAYWPMEDQGSALASPIPGVAPIIVSGSVEFASVDGPHGSDQLPSFQSGSTFSGAVPDPGAMSAWRMDWAFRMDTVISATPRTVGRLVTRSGLEYTARMSEENFHLLVRSDGGTVLVDATQALDSRLIGAVARGVLLGQSSGSNVNVTLRASVGGVMVQQITDTVTNRSISRPAQVWMGVLADDIPSRTVGQITVSRSIADPWAANGLTAEDGFTGELAAARIQRLCGEENVPATIIGDGATSKRMGPQRPADFLELLRECESTDGGILHELDAGIGYRTRVDMYNQDPVLTLDAGDGPGDITHPFTPTLDDQRIVNDITVSQAGGSSSRLTDEADVKRRGRYTGSAEVNVERDVQTQLHASWRLHHGTWPGMRYPSVSPAIDQKPELLPAWDLVALGDHIQVKGLPPQHPLDMVELLVQGYTETYQPRGMQVEVNASPAGPYRVLEIGHATQNWLHPVGHVLDGPIDDEETTFDVAVTDAVWTTDSGDYPRDIIIGGEVMTVTAVGAVSSGTQPFTVTRGINGITKPHAAGSPVELHPTFVLGL